jgi:small subunit ribosomal protein S16
MLKIKLVRVGKRNEPRYRIVVAEARSKLNGKYVEKLGHYIPKPEKICQINRERYLYWLKQGAQPTPTVAKLWKN